MTSAVPPASAWSKLLAFVRDPSMRVTPATIGAAVHFSVVNADVASSLLSAMRGVYAPSVLKNRSWPAGVRAELVGQTHKYLALLTERSQELRGRTVLYVPELDEGVPGGGSLAEADPDAAECKDLTQRLESLVIHWTRQIREVANELGPRRRGTTRARSRRSRTGAAGRRTSPGFARSSETRACGRRRVSDAREIGLPRQVPRAQGRRRRAGGRGAGNLKFLQTLTAPCEALAKAKARDVPALCPKFCTASGSSGTRANTTTSRSASSGS